MFSLSKLVLLNGEHNYFDGQYASLACHTHTPKEMVFGEGTIGKHIFNKDEKCIKCGCSKNAVNNFKWECTVRNMV